MSENPYATPTANLISDTPDSIDGLINELDVSEKWKERFHAINAAGGHKLKKIKELPKSERKKAFSFNILAFLFGPLYYIAKGMWKRGIFLLVCLVAVIIAATFALEHFGYLKFANALGYGAAAVYAMRANLDYYRKMVLNDNGWV